MPSPVSLFYIDQYNTRNIPWPITILYYGVNVECVENAIREPFFLY
jgi:hypothetical protein